MKIGTERFSGMKSMNLDLILWSKFDFYVSNEDGFLIFGYNNLHFSWFLTFKFESTPTPSLLLYSILVQNRIVDIVIENFIYQTTWEIVRSCQQLSLAEITDE